MCQVLCVDAFRRYFPSPRAQQNTTGICQKHKTAFKARGLCEKFQILPFTSSSSGGWSCLSVCFSNLLNFGTFLPVGFWNPGSDRHLKELGDITGVGLDGGLWLEFAGWNFNLLVFRYETTSLSFLKLAVFGDSQVLHNRYKQEVFARRIFLGLINYLWNSRFSGSVLPWAATEGFRWEILSGNFHLNYCSFYDLLPDRFLVLAPSLKSENLSLKLRNR